MRPSHWILIAGLLVSEAGCTGAARDPVYSGTIEAVEVDIVAEVSGRILTHPVDQGDTVEPGDIIATIDPEPYRIALEETRASLEQARAGLTQAAAGYRPEDIEVAAREVEEARAQVVLAEAQVARAEELFREQVVQEESLDTARRDRNVARARLQAAEARHALLRKGYRSEEKDQAGAEVRRLEAMLEQRELDLERTTLRSPVKGTVTEKLQEPGEYARPGSPIVAVADLMNLYTWVYLGEAELPRVKVGDEVAVRIDGAPGRDFPGRVVYISTQAEFTPRNVQTRDDRVQLVYGVKVAVPNPDGTLKVGIPADVALRSRGPS
ncbi:MAG TPA: HlyD family efflux transporter periplasmic adaptor subunit [Candidatus Polarisedimenticolia bacterium]|nr:HlyD family efflux transporter periplasmic adaptor subunit [Candidatus Polarisedimenticolia bacterium]